MWRCEVRIGALVLTSVQLAPGAPEDTDPPLPQLVEVRVTDELDVNAQTWPLVQGPSTAKLSVLMATASQAADIDADTTVSVELYRQAADAAPVVSFKGRASDPTITPHELGVMVEVTCSDYLSDLADETVGSVDWPAETTELRWSRLFTSAGVPVPDELVDVDEWWELEHSWVPADGSHPAVPQAFWPMHAARSASATDLLSEAQLTLAHAVLQRRAWLLQTGARYFGETLYELRPHITGGALDPVRPWQVVPLVRELPANAPLRFVLVGTKWEARYSSAADVAAVSIPAELTSFDATWGRRPTTDINTVDVVLADQSVQRTTQAGAGVRKVTDRRETPLTGQWVAGAASTWDIPKQPARLLADYLLPDAIEVPGSSWEAERFVVELDRAGAPADWWPGQLREVRTVAGLQPIHHPEARDHYTGVMAFREVALADGECRVEVGLIPRPLSASPDSITIQEVPTAVRFSTVGTTVTIQDAAQIRL